MMPTTITMFRPTGQPEFDLLEATGFKRWPPRLSGQPIFYPVTNIEYARHIASKWNTKDPKNGSVGYVFSFQVNKSFVDCYEIQRVGARHHTEWWIPAENLDNLNSNIVGTITLLETHRPE